MRRIAIAVCLAVCGCTTLFWETGLPGARAQFTVQSVVARGPWLDVTVRSDVITRRFFTPRSDECLAMLHTEYTVTLGTAAGWGPFRSGDQECPVVGIGNLEDFRKSRSQGGGYGQSPIRRSSDRIEIVYRDESYLYARGGFSIAAMFGWAPGTDQVVGLLPRSGACLRLDGGGPVSIVFRQAGEPALGIPVGDGLCPVDAVIATTPGQFDALAPSP
jgi:hypothetical protein